MPAFADLDTGSVTQLASGHDFYSSPALSPDGNQLAFVAWSHPNMPWDDTFLYLAAFDEKGLLQEPK
jgi:Tol biopolymer transport system component